MPCLALAFAHRGVVALADCLCVVMIHVARASSQLSDMFCAAHCAGPTMVALALGVGCGQAVTLADHACSDVEHSLSILEDAVRTPS